LKQGNCPLWANVPFPYNIVKLLEEDAIKCASLETVKLMLEISVQGYKQQMSSWLKQADDALKPMYTSILVLRRKQNIYMYSQDMNPELKTGIFSPVQPSLWYSQPCLS